MLQAFVVLGHSSEPNCYAMPSLPLWASESVCLIRSLTVAVGLGIRWDFLEDVVSFKNGTRSKQESLGEMDDPREEPTSGLNVQVQALARAADPRLEGIRGLPEFDQFRSTPERMIELMIHQVEIQVGFRILRIVDAAEQEDIDRRGIEPQLNATIFSSR